MIEVISSDRCIDCDLCVKVCPTNVFDAMPGDHPVIARQGDCQTCFLCEAYCPVDAMFVAPTTDAVLSDSPFLDEEFLIASGLMGKYRRDLGWRPGDVLTAKKASGRPLRAQFAKMENLPPPAPVEDARRAS
ncbi:MAG: 4Fe-4S ferredoxin iron-sulfur binding protein [Ilumatobacteraceae bacterium]|nr:4Fe-4S ferredoxin iron-sulfur binding protein [Ilumatobacteraceae bacterium]